MSLVLSSQNNRNQKWTLSILSTQAEKQTYFKCPQWLFCFESKLSICTAQSLLTSSFFYCLAMPCGLLVPRPGIEPTPPALEAQSLNQWTAREVPDQSLLIPQLVLLHLFPTFSLYWLHSHISCSKLFHLRRRANTIKRKSKNQNFPQTHTGCSPSPQVMMVLRPAPFYVCMAARLVGSQSGLEPWTW